MFSKIILLWLSASILSEHSPSARESTPIDDNLAVTNSFKSSGFMNKGQESLHSLSAVNGQILGIIVIPQVLEIIAHHLELFHANLRYSP